MRAPAAHGVTIKMSLTFAELLVVVVVNVIAPL